MFQWPRCRGYCQYNHNIHLMCGSLKGPDLGNQVDWSFCVTCRSLWKNRDKLEDFMIFSRSLFLWETMNCMEVVFLVIKASGEG